MLPACIVLRAGVFFQPMRKSILPLFFVTLLLQFLLYPSVARAVDASETPVALLEQFDATADAQRVALANKFFHQLKAIGFIDETVHFDTGTPVDSVCQQVYYWAGELLYDQQQYQQAVERCLQALPLFHGDAAADCLSLVSLCYVRLGNYKQAIDYARQCYELDLKSNDQDRISSSLNTLAGIYVGAGLPNEAESYALKGIELCNEVHNMPRLAVLCSTAADIYHALDSQQLSLSYATRARDIDLQLGNNERAAVRKMQMAAALIGLDSLKQAGDCLQEAIPVLQASGNYHSLAIACNKMGELCNHQDKHSEAARYYQIALQVFQAMGDTYNELHAQLGLYKSLKDSLPEDAEAHFQRYNHLRDSLYNHETASAMGFQSALLGNAELQAENEQHRARARAFLIIGTSLVFLLIIGLVMYLRQCQRTREFERQFNELSSSLDETNDTPAQHAEGQSSEERPARPAHHNLQDQEFMDKVKTIVDRQIDEGHIDVAALAQEMCMSMTTFRRRFTAVVQEKPQAYLMRLRMEKARQLLDTHPELNVQEVGLRCGFEDKSNFTRSFKHTFGVTPSEYIRR